MSEFLRLLPPDEARALLLHQLAGPITEWESIDSSGALGRVTAEDLVAPHPLPEFPRSTVDGFAVRARDTFGASEALPAYLSPAGEVPMGDTPAFVLQAGQCALIHTGGMLPEGSDAVVMLEHAQKIKKAGFDQDRNGSLSSSPGSMAAQDPAEIEILKAVAEGENVIRIGEDVSTGAVVIPRGRRLRPAEIGGLMALGTTSVRVIRRIRAGLISSGDEVVQPSLRPRPGQVRDVNAYTLASLVTSAGGEAVFYGIVPDRRQVLADTAASALVECDLVVITAGSSASTRDMTADVIAALGPPGVLVHGINTKPGKPTILGVCRGKAVIGLPGNPVSALVNGYLFVVPVIEQLLGLPGNRIPPSVLARLTVNIPSQAGREDWIPVRLVPSNRDNQGGMDQFEAQPIFGKSNLIFTLSAANGLLRIPPDAAGVSAGEMVNVLLI